MFSSKLVSRGALRALSYSFLALAGVSARAADLPDGLGWHPLPNTTLRSVCPGGFGNCANIVAAWNGATFDTSRDRLIIWGGGHADYSGNEVYALELSTQTMKRLNSPSNGSPTVCDNNGIMPDGKPVARHTYNHLAYIAHADRMFAFGGAGVPCGWLLGDTWTLDMATLTWQKMNPSGSKPDANYGYVAAYDPATKKVYMQGVTKLYAYTLETDSYQTLNTDSFTSNYFSGTIDTKRHQFVIVGDGFVFAYDISAGSSYTRQTWNTTGDNSIVQQGYPGVAYDAVRDRIVAWDGGDTVYSLNPDTKVWTATTHSGGPGAPQVNGTFGRFAYSPASNAFVLVNSADQDAYVLRLSDAEGSPPPPPSEPAPPPPPSGSDFETRCQSPGVLKCIGFDSASELASGLYPAGDGQIRGTVDTNIKASGDGSLKFTLPASQGANAAGSWSTTLGQNFGENSTFYVQFRQRLSPEMLTPSNGGGGFKQVIFHHSSSTCGNVEIATNNGFWRGYPQMYSRCGNDAFDKALAGGDYLLQTGTDYQCHYQSPTSRTPPCGYYRTNEWLTFYYKVSIGNWGQANSLVQAWMGYDGEPLKQFINEENLTLLQDGSGTLYNTITLLPYDTGRTSASSTAYTWYDDLIISTQPIPPPGESAAPGVRPSPPTNVTVR